MRPEIGWAAALAAFTLAGMLAVIAASASIRLAARFDGNATGEQVQAARVVRQGAGGAVALGVLVLSIGVHAIRNARASLGPAALAALGLTAVLSTIGFVTGREPPPAAAFLNQFGGVLLAGMLGFLLGRARPARTDARLATLASVALGLCIAQAAFGGAIATLAADAPLLPTVLHAAAGLAAAACIFAVARRCEAYERFLLGAAAASAPLAGVALAAQLAPSSALQVAHTLAAAILVAAAAYTRARFASA